MPAWYVQCCLLQISRKHYSVVPPKIDNWVIWFFSSGHISIFNIFFVLNSGGLNEKSTHTHTPHTPHSLRHLSSWFPVCGTVWIGLGGVALLKKVCHWGWALRFQSSKQALTALTFSAACWFRYGVLSDTLASCLPGYCHVSYHEDNGLNLWN